MMKRDFKIIIFALILITLSSSLLPAHDITDKEILGIGDYMELRFWPDMITMEYWIGLGDIESMNYRRMMDTDKDGIISDKEQKLFLEALTEKIVSDKFTVELDGNKIGFKIPFESGWPKIELSGELGIKPVRVKFSFPSFHETAGPINVAHRIRFRAKNILDKPVHLKVYVAVEQGVSVKYSPEEEKIAVIMKQGKPVKPNEEIEMNMEYRVLNAAAIATSGTRLIDFFSQTNIQQSADKTKDKLLGFLTEKDLTFGIILVAILIAFFYGAAHALAPGHGKTLVAAYLVGSKGTAWDAVFLGLTVTLTHVSVVIFVGVFALVASSFTNSAQLTGILGVTSGILIFVISIFMIFRRIKAIRTGIEPSHGHSHNHADEEHEHHHDGHEHPHIHDHNHDSHEHSHDEHAHEPHGHEHPHEHSHEHGHTHTHDHTGKITLGTLLPLGISGGMLPCPAAIVVLLMAISINRIAWGLALIFAFSLGLASVLVTIGVLLVSGSKLLNKAKAAPKIIKILSFLGPCVIMVLGILIAIKSFKDMGLL